MSTPLRDVRKIVRHKGIMKPSELALASARRFDPTATKFVIRLYDDLNREWTNVTDPLDAEEAMKQWEVHNNEGMNTHTGKIDYYAIWPAK